MIRMFNLVILSLLFILLIVIVFSVTNARAEPFYWCGATPDATKWELKIDGVVFELETSHIANETAWLKYDLAGIPNGEHFTEVRAGNLWGWSAWFPLDFTKAAADVIASPYIDI